MRWTGYSGDRTLLPAVRIARKANFRQDVEPLDRDQFRAGAATYARVPTCRIGQVKDVELITSKIGRENKAPRWVNDHRMRVRGDLMISVNAASKLLEDASGGSRWFHQARSEKHYRRPRHKSQR